MVYEVVNRGNKILPLFFTVGATAANPQGDAFLYRSGNLYLWSGWQGDIAFNPAATIETIQVPVVSGVTGPTFARFVAVSGSTRPLPGAGRTALERPGARAHHFAPSARSPSWCTRPRPASPRPARIRRPRASRRR